MVLMGSSLFFVYALPGRGDGSAAEAPWASRLLACAGTLLAATALLSILGQASILSGSFSEGLKPETLSAVATGMDLGKAAIIRAAAAGLAVLLILVLKPFKLGDDIKALGEQGVVSEIQIFNTYLITADNKTLVYPNGPLANGTIINYTKENDCI